MSCAERIIRRFTQRVALCLRATVLYLNDVEHEGALEVLGDIDVRIVQNVLQAMHASLE